LSCSKKYYFPFAPPDDPTRFAKSVALSSVDSTLFLTGEVSASVVRRFDLFSSLFFFSEILSHVTSPFFTTLFDPRLIASPAFSFFPDFSHNNPISVPIFSFLFLLLGGSRSASFPLFSVLALEHQLFLIFFLVYFSYWPHRRCILSDPLLPASFF